MAGSYTRMLLKTANFNQVRSQREAIRKDYLHLEQLAHEKDVQAASLGSLASEISALYGLKQSRMAAAKVAPSSVSEAAAKPATTGGEEFTQQAYARSI